VRDERGQEELAGHGTTRFAVRVKILSVVGNRPQFIKAGPVSLALRDRATEIMLHTGQHYDPELSAIFFEELGLQTPAYRLEAGSGSHAEQTARMLPGIEKAVLAERPDVVLVYGDTNSTLAGALAAAKMGYPVAHVEAGLRSFDLTMPEELNRMLVDRLSSTLFAPTDVAVENLATEGIREGVHLVGDVMLDANRRLAPLARERSGALDQLGLVPESYLLLTLHREANMRSPALELIASALNRLNEPVVFPAHPRTRATLEERGIELKDVVRVLPAIGYVDFAALASQARLILTDSGGVQKEAYWYGVPCVTLRENTEWGETVEVGWNRLVGSDPDRIVEAIVEAAVPEKHPQLYGDGRAADLIADVICTMHRQ
jgi:UDP-N-acetylglucosamine 2-epimerase